jgi:hypothetical protein
MPAEIAPFHSEHIASTGAIRLYHSAMLAELLFQRHQKKRLDLTSGMPFLLALCDLAFAGRARKREEFLGLTYRSWPSNNDMISLATGGNVTL